MSILHKLSFVRKACACQLFSLSFILCISLCVLAVPKTLWAEPHNETPTLPLSQSQSGQSLVPYMEYMVDVSGMTTLLELFSPSYEDAFTPLSQGIPLSDTGSTWLRLAIRPDSVSHAIALGSELATDVKLYVPDYAQYASNMRMLSHDDSSSSGAAQTTNNSSLTMSDKVSVATPWKELIIPHGEALTLPAVNDAHVLEQLQGVSLPVYIQMAGTPEPWFTPQLRTMTDIAHDNSRLVHIGITMMLAAVLALCLLRAFTEKGQWRLWTTLFTLALLVQSLVGLPSTPHGSIGLAGLPNVLAPALALMLLPHIARHMLRRTEFSSKHAPAPDSHLDSDLDKQYSFLSIPCILIAIVPLLPTMGWLGKVLPLWPFAVVLFLPTTAIALFRGIAGAKLFLFGCLAAIAGALCALVAMLMDMPATIINAIPLCGTALCALLIAGASGARAKAEACADAKAEVSGAEQSVQDIPKVHASNVVIREDYVDPLLGEGLRLVSPEEGLATGIVVEGKVVPDGRVFPDSTTEPYGKSVLDAPNEHMTNDVPDAKLIANEPPIKTVCDSHELQERAIENVQEAVQEKEQAEDVSGNIAVANTEELVVPSDAVGTSLLESVDTGETTEPASTATAVATKSSASSLRLPMVEDDVQTLVRAEQAMRYPLENLRKSMDALQGCVLNPDTKALCNEAAFASEQLGLVAEDFRRAVYQLPTEPASMIFDLQRCLREAHDNVCARSDAKNVALSWFMAPHLVQTYQGDADRLRTTLRVLMESAVDATDKGSVYLSARRVPDSTNPGHLLFTITDTGVGGPPKHRKAAALMQAWELATSTGGSLSIDSGMHGTTISFSTRFLAIQDRKSVV